MRKISFLPSKVSSINNSICEVSSIEIGICFRKEYKKVRESETPCLTIYTIIRKTKSTLDKFEWTVETRPISRKNLLLKYPLLNWDSTNLVPDTSVSVMITPLRSNPLASALVREHCLKSYNLSRCAFAWPIALELNLHLVLSEVSIGGSLNLFVWPCREKGEEYKEYWILHYVKKKVEKSIEKRINSNKGNIRRNVLCIVTSN